MLSRLGYLDPIWNPDLAEALLTFVNTADNKYKLRKFGTLPSPSDSLADVTAKLRHSFLNDAFGFDWRIAPQDVEAKLILCKQGHPDTRTASKAQVIEAMRKFVRKNKLPCKQNFNSYVGEVLFSSTLVDASSIGRVEFGR